MDKKSNPERRYKITRRAVAVTATTNRVEAERTAVQRANAPTPPKPAGAWLLAIKFASVRDARGADGQFRTDPYGARLTEPTGGGEVIKANIGSAFTLVSESPGLQIYAPYGSACTEEELAILMPTVNAACHEPPFMEFRPSVLAWKQEWTSLADYRAWFDSLRKPPQELRKGLGKVRRADFQMTGVPGGDRLVLPARWSPYDI